MDSTVHSKLALPINESLEFFLLLSETEEEERECKNEHVLKHRSCRWHFSRLLTLYVRQRRAMFSDSRSAEKQIFIV